MSSFSSVEMLTILKIEKKMSSISTMNVDVQRTVGLVSFLMINFQIEVHLTIIVIALDFKNENTL